MRECPVTPAQIARHSTEIYNILWCNQRLSNTFDVIGSCNCNLSLMTSGTINSWHQHDTSNAGLLPGWSREKTTLRTWLMENWPVDCPCTTGYYNIYFPASLCPPLWPPLCCGLPACPLRRGEGWSGRDEGERKESGLEAYVNRRMIDKELGFTGYYLGYLLLDGNKWCEKLAIQCRRQHSIRDDHRWSLMVSVDDLW